MTKEKCTVVMYHYVRNMHETDYPGIKGLLVEKFRKQVDFLKKSYSIISLEDYIRFLNKEEKIPQNSAILSFDDGFKDHYLNVFPVLKEKGIKGCFFPLTQPLAEEKGPAVHKTHFLLAKIGSEQFSKEFNLALKEMFPEMLEDFFVDGKQKQERKYRWDDALTANLKYDIATMPTKPKVEILNQVFSKHFEDEKMFCKQLYMSWDEMKEMSEEGMEFGGHTKSHPMLGKLDEKGQLEELQESKAVLEKGLGAKISLFSYPYGNFNDTTIKLLKMLGYSCGVTTEALVNVGIVSPFKISRLDTNDISSE